MTDYELDKLAYETSCYAARLLGIEQPDLETVRYPNETASGAYHPLEERIHVNFSACRTVRDVVFTVCHEMVHAMQHQRSGVSGQRYLKNALRDFDRVGYENSKYEIEADLIGFLIENTMDYTNEVLDPSATSVFLSRKMLRSF